MKLGTTLIFLLHLNFQLGNLESDKPRKKVDSRCAKNSSSKRALVSERHHANVESDLPPGFLNPSVKEYLELGKSVPGRPGADYPVLGEVPYTSFYCDNQEWPGFFADVETKCQAWHYCDIDGRQATFLCPNGTQFNQAVFICDWWFNVRCESSFKFYFVNGRLYHKKKTNFGENRQKIKKDLFGNIFT